MRKIKPADVKTDFVTFIDERLAYFDRAAGYLPRRGANTAADLSVLAETTLHSSYVAFERFVSDLLIAYINRDFSQYQASLKAKIESSIKDKYQQFGVDRITFSPVKHIKLDDLEELIDPTGWNKTFASVDQMKSTLHEYVVPALKTGVTGMQVADVKFIDTMRAVRNFIAHGSKGSKKIMNGSLVSVAVNAVVNAPLARGAHEIDVIGSYLKARPTAGAEPRVKIYMARIRDIAMTM